MKDTSYNVPSTRMVHHRYQLYHHPFLIMSLTKCSTLHLYYVVNLICLKLLTGITLNNGEFVNKEFKVLLEYFCSLICCIRFDQLTYILLYNILRIFDIFSKIYPQTYCLSSQTGDIWNCIQICFFRLFQYNLVRYTTLCLKMKTRYLSILVLKECR
jgi:hypothetical protein